jgi:cobalt/nickel transport system permease protein
VHVHWLDPYRHEASAVHALDARPKLALALAYILATALTPPGAWPVYLLLLAIALSIEMLSELGVGWVLRRSALALPFLLAALPLLFTVEGRTLFSLQAGGWTLTATWEGAERLVSIAARSWLSVQIAIVLTASTPFPQLLLALRWLRIPRLLVAVVGLMWRYLFVLVDEVMRLIRARESRSGWRGPVGRARRPGGKLTWRARVTGGMAGTLFVRTFERADRIYAAMASRGYDGEVRTLPLPPVSPGAWTVMAGGLAVLALLVALAYLM